MLKPGTWVLSLCVTRDIFNCHSEKNLPKKGKDRSASATYCTGLKKLVASCAEYYRTSAFVLKPGTGVLDPLGEPIVKPYHAWLLKRTRALTLLLSMQL